MSYVPEEGHLIRPAGWSLPTDTAAKVLAVVDGAMLRRDRRRRGW